MAAITAIWTTRNIPSWLLGTAVWFQKKNYTPATWCRKKERDTFRPLPVFEHVHHPGGEGVDLVGVVPEDETPHPLLILTVAWKKIVNNIRVTMPEDDNVKMLSANDSDMPI
jgi:hypothetical protein